MRRRRRLPLPPPRRARHAWAASLGITLLLLGGAWLLLAALVPEARAWKSSGEFRGVYAAAPPAAPAPLPPLPPMPEPPLPPPPLLPPLPLAPEPPPEPAPVPAEPLVLHSPLLPELPEPALPAAPARRARPAEPSPAAAPAPAAEEGEFTPPAYRSAPHPPYPAAMRQRRVEGSVRLRIHLDAEGTPQRVEIISGSGHAELDSTARDWVLRHWRFTPARRGGSPVPGSVVTSVQFVLSD